MSFRQLAGMSGRAALATVILAAGLTAGLARAHDGGGLEAGAVYTQSNAAAGNAVLAFRRAADGSLTAAGSYRTGGNGLGRGLGSQGAVALSQNGRWLFAVNAGSNSVSSFRVDHRGLALADVVDSGGVRPVSLTVHGNVLYVLNQGSDGIAGFWIGNRGELEPIPHSARPLSAPNANGAEIAFSPDGDVLVVTLRALSVIDTFPVEDDVARPALPSPAAGQGPFGFDFDRRGRIFVTEAASTTVSSYQVSEDDGARAISAAVPAGGNAPCWLVVTRNGRYAFETNAASGTVSRFAIAHDGSITFLGTAPALGAGVTDEALSGGSRYLYALMGGSGAIDAFAVGQDGSLTPIAGAVLPAGAAGLAAR